MSLFGDANASSSALFNLRRQHNPASMSDFTLKNMYLHTYIYTNWEFIFNLIKINVQTKITGAKDRRSSYIYILYLHKSRLYYEL